jgi:polar amino acid transport system permease protein
MGLVSPGRIGGPSGPPGSSVPGRSHRRRSLLLTSGSGGERRALLVAFASTALVFGLLGWLVVNSPGWPAVQRAFFNGRYFAESWPNQLAAIATNIQLFLVAEVLILPFALVIAVMRSLPGPAFFPVRLMAVIYTDFFRGVPGLLIIFMLGFGMPALGIEGIPNDTFFWGVISLVLLYSAYVSEVYRAGIDSVHPSQEAAARSLGLSQVQALRYVVIPQAVRRVIPPLLNDFIGLQKDTALVSTIGVLEVFRQAQIDQYARFNFTPYLATAILFLAMTVPLARFTDWLVARDRRRQLAGRAR